MRRRPWLPALGDASTEPHNAGGVMKLGLAGVVALSIFFVVAPTRAQPQAPFGAGDPGCVRDTKAHHPCPNPVASGFAHLITSLAQCHRNHADAAFFHTPFDEETCENNARAQ